MGLSGRPAMMALRDVAVYLGSSGLLARAPPPEIETPAAARAGMASEAVAGDTVTLQPDLFAGVTAAGAQVFQGGVSAAAQFVPGLSALAASPGRLRTALESDEASALQRVLRAMRVLLQRLGADHELAAALRAPDVLLRALLRYDFEAAAKLCDQVALGWAALDHEGVTWLREQQRAGGVAGNRAARLLVQLGAPLRRSG